jgi:hypothetical protein
LLRTSSCPAPTLGRRARRRVALAAIEEGHRDPKRLARQQNRKGSNARCLPVKYVRYKVTIVGSFKILIAACVLFLTG